MALVDNSNWVRSSLGSQFGNLQNQMAPNGAMWEQYLNSTNPLMNSVMSMINPSQAMLWGGSGMPGYLDSLMQYGGNLPALMQQMTGGTGAAQNTIGNIDQILNQQGSFINPLMQQFMQGQGKKCRQCQLDGRGSSAQWKSEMNLAKIL